MVQYLPQSRETGDGGRTLLRRVAHVLRGAHAFSLAKAYSSLEDSKGSDLSNAANGTFHAGSVQSCIAKHWRVRARAHVYNFVDMPYTNLHDANVIFP